MKSFAKKLRYYGFLTVLTVFIFCLVSTFVPAGNTYAATKKTAYATCDDLNLRKSNNSSSKILKKFDRGDKFYVTGSKGKWYKVQSGSKKGYIYKDYVSYKKPAKEDKKESKKVTGEDVVKYAKKFVGNPYKYGGTSLTKGADCSGFTMAVYKNFGVKLPHSSSAQRSCGKKVASLSKAKAGDLICYYGHVAIYMGNNKIVHASNKKTGIKISNNAKYRKIASIRRVL